jgi:hypothetical protein
MPFAVTFPRWTTAAIADPCDTTPMELSALVAHVGHCHHSRGPWFRLRCGTDAMHQFTAARFVTTLAIVAVALALTALAL